MKQKARRKLALLLAAVMLTGVLSVGASAAEGDDGKTVIRVFETTDIHGYLIDTSFVDAATGDDSKIQYRMAYIAQQVNNARNSEEYDDVLLLNGGNNYEGTPVMNLLQGSAMRAAFDAMQYDATAIGNHEFDYGIDTVNCDPDGTIAAYELGDISGDPTVPVLAYNLYKKGTTDRVDFAKDYVVVEKAGKKVALIGYISDFNAQVMASKIAPYEIDDSTEHLNAKNKEVNETEKPDVTIVVGFAGASGLAEKVDPAEVDLVIGGHNQASSGKAAVASNGVAYLESACYA